MALITTTIASARNMEAIRPDEQSAGKADAKTTKAKKGKVSNIGPSTSAKPKVTRSLTATSNGKAARSHASVASLTKTEIVLKKLRLARGVTLAQLMEATGWQAHSVRGFLSAVVRKRLGLNLLSEVGKDGQRRYRVVDGDGDGDAGAGQAA